MSFQNHPAIATYNARLQNLKAHGHITEEQTRHAFAVMLDSICTERNLYFVAEIPVGPRMRRKIDGAIKDEYSEIGYWEAKDEKDDLEAEVTFKRSLGYPLSNTIFEDTRQAILWQNQKFAGKFDITRPEQMAELLEKFFNHTEADRAGFEVAVKDFVKNIPRLARGLRDTIEGEQGNPRFAQAFESFLLTCRLALNPGLKESAVKEMLIQHLLTERLFRGVFQNAEWLARNPIAAEIESVIAALTSRKWSRAGFFSKIDPFYKPIEDRARTLPDYSAKQGFLNTVYERFFQGYSTETADTMGIVYTPQEIVDWMCQSVQQVLASEFGLAVETPGVKILDPCTGTGNFIVNMMGRIPRDRLPQKYAQDLFANEVMLLPYYVASGNIEHEYFERMGDYQPFEGLCFADTLDLFEGGQLSMMAEKNTARVAAQKKAEITVIIGNPPYNVGQKNENDNNKNRAYKGLRKGEKGIDDLISETYARASNATNKNMLYDPYVRFFRWATERLKGADGKLRDGVVCFVSNNSFVDQHAFDGMRKMLGEEFTHIWHLDLHGNVRRNPKLSGTTHNVFGIQVGVGITILVRNSKSPDRFIRYFRVPENWRKSEKLAFLTEHADVTKVDWQVLAPNSKNAWLTEGLEADFDTFTPLGTKEAKANFGGDSKTVFKTYSGGMKTNRDDWVFNFGRETLQAKIETFIAEYNAEVERWQDSDKSTPIDDFVSYDKIKWSRDLKADLKRGHKVAFDESKMRRAIYRPFCKQWLYFDSVLNEEVYLQPRAFPKPETENRVIVVTDVAGEKPFMALMTDCIADLHTVGAGASSQCFPLYTYSADGSIRYDNVTGYAVDAKGLATREDVFYATYALLHHPAYRSKYAENIKRELPRLPLDFPGWGAEEWKALCRIGRALGDLHTGYESATPFPLAARDTTPPGQPYSFRVEKMRFNADKSQLKLNDSITLSGFTPAMFEYRLGNRSALDWLVESYRLKHDDRSGLASDPNRPHEPRFILDLIARVATVSLDTQRLLQQLPPMP